MWVCVYLINWKEVAYLNNESIHDWGRGEGSVCLLAFSSVVWIIQLVGTLLLMEIVLPCGAWTLKCPLASCGEHCQRLLFPGDTLTAACCLFWASHASWPEGSLVLLSTGFSQQEKVLQLVDSPPQTAFSPLLSSVLWENPCPIMDEIKEEMRTKLEGVSRKEVTENKKDRTC